MHGVVVCHWCLLLMIPLLGGVGLAVGGRNGEAGKGLEIGED